MQKLNSKANPRGQPTLSKFRKVVQLSFDASTKALALQPRQSFPLAIGRPIPSFGILGQFPVRLNDVASSSNTSADFYAQSAGPCEKDPNIFDTENITILGYSNFVAFGSFLRGKTGKSEKNEELLALAVTEYVLADREHW